MSSAFKIRCIRDDEEEEVYHYWKEGILTEHRKDSKEYFLKLTSIRSIFVITG
jgi:hypothetical protein